MEEVGERSDGFRWASMVADCGSNVTLGEIKSMGTKERGERKGFTVWSWSQIMVARSLGYDSDLEEGRWDRVFDIGLK